MTLSDVKPGKYDDVVVLFSDIRNFTKLIVELSFEEVMHLLRIYFDEMAGIILANHGVVGTFVGDAIVGYFGLDKSEKNHADNAVKAALLIKEKIRFINIGREIPVLNGMGIDGGSISVGTVSTNDELKQIIVIGAPINKASRFERLTRISCHRIMMSKSVFEHLSPQIKEQFVDIGCCEVRGIEGLIPLYADIITKK